MKYSVGVALVGAAVCFFDTGCKETCGDAAPSLLLELIVSDVQVAGSIRSLEVVLELENKRLRKNYALGDELADGRTSLVIDLEPAPAQAADFRVVVRAHDSSVDAPIAEAVLDNRLEPNACNVFAITLAPVAIVDGGVGDADASARDADDAAVRDAEDAGDLGGGEVGIRDASDGGEIPDVDGGEIPDVPGGADADGGAGDIEPGRDFDFFDADAPDVPRPPACGDGNLDMGEICDDNNLTDGDGCDSNCTPTSCGNRIVTAGETCDDGNILSGDGCDSNCTPTSCGNMILTAGETCDDGNIVDGDGCDSNCTPTSCGNMILSSGEECDDGNLVSGDGCDASCDFELIRRLITVDNSANSMALSNYPVLVTLDTALAISEGKMQIDGDDLRFFAADGVTLLDYWIASTVGTATTAIWVEVPSIAASASTTIQVAYRDPSAVAASNGETTFLYFADFNNSTLGNNGAQEQLNALAGSWSVVAAGRQGRGYEEVGTAGRQSVLGTGSWGDVAVSVSVRLPIAVSGGVNGIYMRAADLNNLYFFGPFQQNGVTFGKYSGGVYSAISDIVLAVQREQWHEITLAASGSMFRGYLNGALMISSTDASFASGQIGLRTWGTNVRYDDLRVRPYYPPEPLIFVGSEQ